MGYERSVGNAEYPTTILGCKRAGRAGLQELGVWVEVRALLGHAKAVRYVGTTLTC